MRKYAIISTVIGVALIATPAFADNDKKEKSQGALKALDKVIERLEKFELPEVESAGDRPAELFIGRQGNLRIIGGEVTGTGSTSLTVKAWGHSFAVDTSSAKFHPNGTTMANIVVGSKVNIKGSIDSSGAVTATTVNLITPRPAVVDELMKRINELIQRIREIQARLGLPLTPFPTPPGTPPPPPPPADTTAPTISGITVDSVASTSARVRWITNESADSKVWYGTTTPVLASAPTLNVASTVLVTSHEFTLSSLAASTTYYALVVSKDTAGNTATSSQFSWTMLP